jgi:hypothetical protein
MAADKTPIDPKKDLAGYEALGSRQPFQLWIGGTPVITDAGVSAVATLPIYSLAALLADNTVVAFDPATHDPKQAVITAVQIDAIGQAVPYWDSGKFNHEAVNFPAAWNTYEERKTGLQGSMGLRVGHLI